ncbi:hypothetical protein EDC60_2429 [Diaphorobacter nitroreducens]|uniref:Lipoprotein n=1 Tax=Diaphorobacter nitroreducens TaxID=164759 RepID=A0AAX1WTA3_9BURK|nr:hypothetical protein EDC60_2429 [Diaphorobacter nitroreducens]
MPQPRRSRQPLRLAAAGVFLCALLSGCTVVAVGSAAVSVTATAVGLAADAAVGTAKVVGKGVGKAYDAMTEDEEDHSGITVRYREGGAPQPLPDAPPQEQVAPTPEALP